MSRRPSVVPAGASVPVQVSNPNPLSFSLKEAAAVTGVALWGIRSAIWGRKLQAHVIGKRQIVLRADLERWIAAAPTAHGKVTA
jgi:hypothetical protein